VAGHSKWKQIKRKKAVTDARRGAAFTKLIKEITMAAKAGGGSPAGNARLRLAIDTAKAANMPAENIERAIKKGTGELEGVSYEESQYEGYGPGGAAVLVESLSDNKNRSVAEIRHVFTKNGGNLGASGCVAWMFKKKGYLAIDRKSIDEEKLMEKALEAGAEDVREDEGIFEVITAPEDFETVKAAIDELKVTYISSEVTMLPDNTTELKGKEAEQMMRLMDMLEDCDDVQKVYTNADIPDEMVGRA
jgi:YebC/PmpR family DNA-binding regulatory protein